MITILSAGDNYVKTIWVMGYKSDDFSKIKNADLTTENKHDVAGDHGDAFFNDDHANRLRQLPTESGYYANFVVAGSQIDNNQICQWPKLSSWQLSVLSALPNIIKAA